MLVCCSGWLDWSTRAVMWVMGGGWLGVGNAKGERFKATLTNKGSLTDDCFEDFFFFFQFETCDNMQMAPQLLHIRVTLHTVALVKGGHKGRKWFQTGKWDPQKLGSGCTHTHTHTHTSSRLIRLRLLGKCSGSLRDAHIIS